MSSIASALPNGFAPGFKSTDGKRSVYRELDRIGRIRLSSSFFFRDFLHSEIAATYNIVNMPDDLGLAIETGSRLCGDILEPLQARFGAIRIRSGYRSSALNAFGHKHHLNCASNEKNYATHIWDRLDARGNKGASACVVIPSLITESAQRDEVIQTISDWADTQHQVDHVRFFKQVATFNIGWRTYSHSIR